MSIFTNERFPIIRGEVQKKGVLGNLVNVSKVTFKVIAKLLRSFIRYTARAVCFMGKVMVIASLESIAEMLIQHYINL